MACRSQLIAIPLILLALAGCGGGGGVIASAPSPVTTPTPAPSPTPTPTPTPAPPFTPRAATVFVEPLYNPQLAVAGKGWQHDFVPNKPGTLNLRDADNFSVAYDPASKTYQVSVPVAGAGTLMQVRDDATYPFNEPSAVPGFDADPSNKSATDYCCAALSVAPADRVQSRYRYVSFADFYAPAPSGSLETIAYGTFAIAQPTRPGEVPLTGSARYSGDLFGHLAGDAGATWIEGKVRLDFDFARGALSGDLTAGLHCMMGCQYDSVDYRLTSAGFAPGSTTFAGTLTTAGAPSAGSIVGMFAGPNAAELMAQFRMPFYSPETQRWMDAGGAIAAKRD